MDRYLFNVLVSKIPVCIYIVIKFCQTYTRRKVAKEREKQNEGVQLRPNIEDNRKSNETTKMALPQFEREKKTYTPSECKLFTSAHIFQLTRPIQVL